ncbi:MAG: hypothetical protein AB1861_23720 [Cyanobacteriota bacterium]
MEIARKRPVWFALSEFWLDTELQTEDLKRIAEVLEQSGYALADIEQIYKFEVAPVVWMNIFPFYPGIGVWEGFDTEWLEESILSNIGRQEKNSFYRWRIRNKFSCWMHTMTSREPWQKCKAMVNEHAV